MQVAEYYYKLSMQSKPTHIPAYITLAKLSARKVIIVNK